MKNNLALGIAASSLFACIAVPGLHEHFGIVAPVVMQSVIIILRDSKDNNDDEGLD